MRVITEHTARRPAATLTPVPSARVHACTATTTTTTTTASAQTLRSPLAASVAVRVYVCTLFAGFLPCADRTVRSVSVSTVRGLRAPLGNSSCLRARIAVCVFVAYIIYCLQRALFHSVRVSNSPWILSATHAMRVVFTLAQMRRVFVNML